MAISKIVEEKAIQAYIDTNGNQTQSYLASHPNAKYNTANQNSSNFMLKYDIPNKALAIAIKHNKLNINSALEKLADSMDAKKVVHYLGQKIDTVADNPVRLDATKFLLEKIYGVGNQTDMTINNNNTINVSITDMTSVSKELKSLTKQTADFMDKLNNSVDI